MLELVLDEPQCNFIALLIIAIFSSSSATGHFTYICKVFQLTFIPQPIST